MYRTWGYEMQLCGPDPCRIDDESVSYYDAADRLRVHNRHVGLGGVSHAGGVYEEYSYDALGRRVTTRSRSTASCIGKPECNSYLERTAWDGDQVLMENRASGRQGATSAQLNSNNTTGLAADDYLLGRVRYTHAGGIDAPVTVIRQLMQNQPASVAVAPHANWQGDFEIGTLMSGVLTHTCAGSGCPPISWPGHQTTADGEWASPSPPTSWFGSMIGNRVDGSGLQYLRNRYYDPKTGRFTQEDPIGLAGGLNLYGFGGGDPVNFSDPLGLCPIPPSNCLDVGFLALDIADFARNPSWGSAGGMLLGGVALIPGVPSISAINRGRNAAMVARSTARAQETIGAVRATTNNIRRELGRFDHLQAARLENTGRLSTGSDHAAELTSFSNSLRNSIVRLKGVMADPNISAAMRSETASLLGQLSRMRDDIQRALR